MNTIQSQLNQAYRLIRSGQRQAALRVLAPICRDYPANASGWWLAAHALEDPRQIRYALEQVLRIAPHYPEANITLDRLNNGVLPPRFATPPNANRATKINQPLYTLIPPSQQAAAQRAYIAHERSKHQARQQLTRFYVIASVLAIVVLGVSILAGVLVYDRLQEAAPSISEVFSNDVGGSDVILVRPTSDTPQPTLPPVVKVVATPDPIQFGDTYWEGSGDGVTMEYLAYDGRYRRFYQLPVKLYATGLQTQVWVNAVDNAIREINQVVPMVLTDSRREADIILEIVSPVEVQRRCVGLSMTRVVGCGAIEYEGEGANGPIISGYALIATDTNNPQGTVLHELLHTMGVIVHSPNSDDIMYHRETRRLVTQMSQRDMNTLRRLYASPSYAD